MRATITRETAGSAFSEAALMVDKVQEAADPAGLVALAATVISGMIDRAGIELVQEAIKLTDIRIAAAEGLREVPVE